MEACLLLGVERDGIALLASLIAAHPQLAWRGPLAPSSSPPSERVGSLPGFAVARDFAGAWSRWPSARFVFVGRAATRDAAERSAERAWRRIAAEIPARQRLEIRYERLVRDPHAECARLCEFLGVPFSASVLRRSLRESEGAGPRRARRVGWWAARRSMRALGAWVKGRVAGFIEESLRSTRSTRSAAISSRNLRATSKR